MHKDIIGRCVQVAAYLRESMLFWRYLEIDFESFIRDYEGTPTHRGCLMKILVTKNPMC